MATIVIGANVKLTVREARMARTALSAQAISTSELSSVVGAIADAFDEALRVWAEGHADPAIITIQITDKATL